MNLIDVKVFSSTGKKILGKVYQGMGSKIDIVSQYIKGFLFLIFFLYVLKNKSRFSYTFLSKDTEYSDIPVNSLVLLAEEVHRSEFQEYAKLIVE